MKTTLKIMMAILAVVALAGCGGSSYLSEWPGEEEWTGETVEVRIEAGAGSTLDYIGPTKDIGAGGSADSDGGDVRTLGEALDVQCEIIYAEKTSCPPGGVGHEVPVVTMLDGQTYDVACAAAGKSLNKCIGCITLKDETGAHCTAYCEGMVPRVSGMDAEEVRMTIEFKSYLNVTGGGDPATAVFVQEGTRTNDGFPWLEADDDIRLILGADHYVLCDGTGDSMEMTAVDPYGDHDFFDIQPAGESKWQKNFTIESMGDGSCAHVVNIDTSVPLTEVNTALKADMFRDEIVLASTWCSDMASCDPLAAIMFEFLVNVGGDPFSLFIIDGAGTPLAQNPDFLLQNMGVGVIYGASNETPFDEAYMNEDNLNINTASAINGLASTMPLNFDMVWYDVNPDPLEENFKQVAVLGMDYDHAYKYQDLDLIINIANQVLEADRSFQKGAIAWPVHSNCALSDDFNIVDTLADCYIISIGGDNIAPLIAARGSAVELEQVAPANGATFDIAKPVFANDGKSLNPNIEFTINVTGMTLTEGNVGDNFKLQLLSEADATDYVEVGLVAHELTGGGALEYCAVFSVFNNGAALVTMPFYIDIGFAAGEDISFKLSRVEVKEGTDYFAGYYHRPLDDWAQIGDNVYVTNIPWLTEGHDDNFNVNVSGDWIVGSLMNVVMDNLLVGNVIGRADVDLNTSNFLDYRGNILKGAGGPEPRPPGTW